MATGKALIEVFCPRGASSAGRGVDRAARGGLAGSGVVAAKLCSGAVRKKKIEEGITFLGARSIVMYLYRWLKGAAVDRAARGDPLQKKMYMGEMMFTTSSYNSSRRYLYTTTFMEGREGGWRTRPQQ